MIDKLTVEVLSFLVFTLVSSVIQYMVYNCLDIVVERTQQQQQADKELSSAKKLHRTKSY